MYENVKACVRVNGSVTDYFDCNNGVKQGEPLSPLLFIFFINDMYEYLYDDNVEMFTLEDMKLFLLLFADDTVLFSYTKSGLQLLLDKLYMYCHEWGITVNPEKSVVMICKKGTRQENDVFMYNDQILKCVNKFTYLGVSVSSNGSLFQAQKSLSEQALKALYSLNSLFDKVSLEISEKLKLFDYMIMPILNYGSEVWGLHNAPDIEHVHKKFLKQLLGVRQQTANAAVYGEFGRVPLLILRKIRVVKYWYRIIKQPDSLMYKLLMMKDRNNQYVNKWSIDVKKLFQNLGFANIFDNPNVIDLKTIIQRIYDQYNQQWLSEISNSSKLETYKIIKDSFDFEKYLSLVINPKFRKALSRFRCSAHRLMIEEGRFRNIDRDQRICLKCNMNEIETEYHFLLVCPFYRELRKEHLPKYYCSWPTLNKFISLMKNSKHGTVNRLSKYIYFANVLRDRTND
jgi:hypothetical protein